MGKRTREARQEMELSQEAFGRRLRWGRNAAQILSKLECARRLPELDKLIQISRLTGKSVGWLAGEE